jgi:hypothetical protein
MVNQTILNYLSNNKQFPLFELKNQIVSSGYSEEEFNEAAKFLGITNYKIKKNNWFKWAWVAGVIGIIFLLGIIISIIPTINLLINGFSLQTNSLIINSETNSLIIISLILIFCLATVLFYFGFERMGKYTKTKTLRVISWVFIGLIVLFVFVFLITSFSENSNIYTQNSINNTSLMPIIISGFFVLLISLFGVGLILVGKKVKFAKTSGILEVLTILIFILSIIKIYYDIKTNQAIGMSIILSIFEGNLKTLNEIIRPYILILLGNQIMSSITIFFQSLSLFNTSKRFE